MYKVKTILEPRNIFSYYRPVLLALGREFNKRFRISQSRSPWVTGQRSTGNGKVTRKKLYYDKVAF